MKTNENPVTSLPKIIRFLGRTDYGPCDDGATAVCPHCGSDGRYVNTFLCDDGSTRGAMDGCIKLFPISRIALEDKRLQERHAELIKRFGSEAKLNSWEARICEAIVAHYAGEADESSTIRIINREKASLTAFRSRRNRR